MPRFSMKALLIAVAIIALWLSTFSGYPGALDVRKTIMLLILIASAFAAAYSSGSRRAFWSGFFVVVLLSRSQIERFIGWSFPTSNWATNYLWDAGYSPEVIGHDVYTTVIETVEFGSNLLLATLMGYIAAYIYDQQNKDG